MRSRNGAHSDGTVKAGEDEVEVASAESNALSATAFEMPGCEDRHRQRKPLAGSREPHRIKPSNSVLILFLEERKKEEGPPDEVEAGSGLG